MQKTFIVDSLYIAQQLTLIQRLLYNSHRITASFGTFFYLLENNSYRKNFIIKVLRDIFKRPNI